MGSVFGPSLRRKVSRPRQQPRVSRGGVGNGRRHSSSVYIPRNGTTLRAHVIKINGYAKGMARDSLGSSMKRPQS